MHLRGTRRAASAALVLAFVAALAAAVIAAPADASTGLVISGRVVDAEGQPISGAGVAADRWASGENQWRRDLVARTDADGNYAIELTYAGSYKVQAFGQYGSSGAYAPIWYPAADRMANAGVITVSKSAVRDINVTMKRGAVISGRIYQPDGTPMPDGSAVRVYPAAGDPDRFSYDLGYPGAGTDAYGNYSISGLNAGSYRVLSDPDPRDDDLHGAPTWLGQTSDFTTAETVTVALGEVTSGHDITSLAAGTMGGQLLHPKTANARPPLQITAFDRSNRSIASTTTDANGNWSVSHLAPGEYRLAFFIPNLQTRQWYGPPSITQAGSKLLTVESGRNTTVNHRLVYSSLKNVKRPSIHGTREVGHYLKASPGTWTGHPSYLSHQWYRDGKRITPAVGPVYKLRSLDAGHRISLVITALRGPAERYERGSATTTRTNAIRR